MIPNKLGIISQDLFIHLTINQRVGAQWGFRGMAKLILVLVFYGALEKDVSP